jgi:EpsD family peptidyl-prolyl cis-trans isomerase
VTGRACVLLGVLAAGLCTGGCERAAAFKPGAPVVLAKVNGTEISSRDIAGAQALEKIIERELLVQKALEAGLDRDPQVAQSIDQARRQLLAHAYLERAAAAAARSTPEEVRAFYAANPALFAERRIYRLRELAVSAPPELLEVLRAETARATDLEEVAAWLRARNARFSAFNVTQPAEQLPLSQLPEIARMKEGDMAVFATPLGASVVQFMHAAEAPLTEQQAAPVIEQFLAARKKMELAAEEVRKLRDGARIEYVGDIKR